MSDRLFLDTSMMRSSSRASVKRVAGGAGLGVAWLCLSLAATVAGQPPITGPETEKRFPPLTLPDGFRATLFACDPLVEYPSVIALGPEPGTLFVAHDYVTGLGIDIVRRDEIRILRDRDRDGYADESLLFAEGFNSVQGLAYHAGSVFVMHAPLLTALTDTDGDGVADQRRDLISGLGLPPEENSNRLHCANGVVAGHDGWLYLALGDRGCDVVRPEGDRLLFQEGGILRCRPDGRDLHVFCRGLRNIYDIALDEELNVFVRDNENDGGDYMIRVCHCFFNSDHGYPYLYHERPGEAMPPLADLGRGSSAGGTAYLEQAFPQPYRESLFFCEWGRAVVTYPKQRASSSFASPHEIDFAAAAANDPYGFKPTDLVVDRDGSLLISDWGDGQRPQRGRGRIYRITHNDAQQGEIAADSAEEGASLQELTRRLNAASYHARVAAQAAIEQRGQPAIPVLQHELASGHLEPLGRLHAVWVLVRLGGHGALEDLFQLAGNDTDARVRAQAVRAIADLADPVLASHRLDAGLGDEDLARRLAQLASDEDPRVQLEIIVALGRCRWSDAPSWLAENWTAFDPALGHAAMQMLRQSHAWPAVLELLDRASEQGEAEPSVRTVTLRALANQAHAAVVDGLCQRLESEATPQQRSEYVDLLARVYKRPGPWTYWGFRPAPRPANPLAWERTEQIAATLNAVLRDPDFAVRMTVVRRMLREQVPIQIEQLTAWLQEDFSAEDVATILDALRERPVAETRPALAKVLASRSYADQNRLSALALYVRELDSGSEESLLQIAQQLEEGPVLTAAIRELAKRPNVPVAALLLSRLKSASDDVRAAASEALARRPDNAVAGQVVDLLQDKDPRVRRAAAELAGKLSVSAAADRLLDGAAGSDLLLRETSLKALQQLQDPRAVPSAVAALDAPESQLAALSYLASFGTLQHLGAVRATAEKSRSIDVLAAAATALRQWRERSSDMGQDRRSVAEAIARIQGSSGVTLLWRVRGPLTGTAAKAILADVVITNDSSDGLLDSKDWTDRLAEGTEARILLPAAKEAAQATWVAVSDLWVEEATDIELFATTSGTMQVWLNGRAFERTQPTTPPQPARFKATLSRGTNRLALEFTAEEAAEFHVRFRPISSKAEHEQLTKVVLDGSGNVERGRELFLNAEKSLCLKCHRLGEQGGRIGPDLTGVGSRFSRIHLIESILDPSRTVAPSYETLSVALASGRVLTGVKTSQTDAVLLLGDNQGQTHEIALSEIDELQTQPRSTMPDGLEQRLTSTEFLDLIEFLLAQKNAP